MKIVDATVSACGDVTILFEQDLILDVFVNATVDECWRAFKIGAEHHLVITGNGLEEE